MGSGVSTGTAGFASGLFPPLGFLPARAWNAPCVLEVGVLIIVVEMVNSAMEAAVDRIGKEHHELSRTAKDLGSAAVFCSIVLSATVWILVFIPC